MAHKAAVRRMSTGLSREEIKELKEVFDMFDKDDSGAIDATELGGVMKTLGKDLSKKELRRMLKRVDTDGNGTVEFPEFVQYICSHSAPVNEEEELQEAFNVFDKNGDGQISIYEVKQVLKNMGENCTDEEVAKMMKAVDKNEDGAIDFEEFKELSKLRSKDTDESDT